MIRNPFRDMLPPAFAITDSTKEAPNRWQIGQAGGTEGGEEFVEEGSGAVEEDGFGAEVEVSVGGEGVVVALGAVEGDVVDVEVALAGGLHGAEEGAVERVVVEGGAEEVVGAGEGGVALEFLFFFSKEY